jgi:hypothetical protein
MSGLDVLDIDPRHGGDTWFVENKARLPMTRVHQTQGGGFHLFFQHESGLRCSIGRIAAGVDVRAEGGYVIWWPGVGLPVTSEMPVAAWPRWLCHQLSHSRPPTTSRITVPLARGRGERNNLTYWAACRAGEMVASGLLRPDAAAAIIVEAARRAGLPRAEAERAAWSGIRRTGGFAHA